MNTIDTTRGTLTKVMQELTKAYGSTRLIKALARVTPDPTMRQYLAKLLVEEPLQ